jgi:fucose 4-O-acetylase-like acetyltransferase
MKGILILLIIFGHNTIISPCIPDIDFYLRSFRTPLFLILPWFYIAAKPPTWSKIAKRSGKMWFWYLVFFIVQVVFYNLLFDTTFSPIETIKAFFLGGHTLLKEVTGYMYLWFMPAFFFAMLIRDAYTIANKTIRRVMIILSLGIVLFFAFHPYTNYIAIIQGVFFAALGITASQLSLPRQTKYQWLIVLLFVICSVLMFINGIKLYVKPFMPYIAFLALWSLIDFGKRYLTWFAKIGNLSMFIYLTHPLIFQFLLRIIPNGNLSQIEYGCIILILTTTISIAVSWGMQKTIKAIPIANKYL